jgi:hypothetical protein
VSRSQKNGEAKTTENAAPKRYTGRGPSGRSESAPKGGVAKSETATVMRPVRAAPRVGRSCPVTLSSTKTVTNIEVGVLGDGHPHGQQHLLGALAHHVREWHPVSVWLPCTCLDARHSMTFSLMKRLND